MWNPKTQGISETADPPSLYMYSWDLSPLHGQPELQSKTLAKKNCSVALVIKEMHVKTTLR